MFDFIFTQTPLKFFIQSFWRDEAFSYLLAKKNIIDILLLTAKDFNPPLYYLLLKLWMTVFGSSEISLRSLSLFFFVGTVYFSFDILTEVCKINWKKALLYLIFFFMNPVLHYYAFEARMYSMVTFFATCSCYAFLTKKKRLYIISTILGLYTHYFMIFIVFVHGLYSLMEVHKKQDMVKVVKKFALPMIAWLPWVVFMFTQQVGKVNTFWIERPTLADFFYIPTILYTGYEKDFGRYNDQINGYTPLLTQMTFVLLGIFIAGIICVYKSKHKEIKLHAIQLGLWAFLPPVLIFIVSLFLTPYFLPRYLIFSTVGLIILIIYLLEKMPIGLRWLYIIFLFILTWQYNTLNLKYREKRNVANIYHKIKPLMKNTDVIYTDDLGFFNAQYYIDPDKVFIYLLPYEQLPSYVGKVLIPPEKTTHTLPTFPRRAFIVKEDKFEIQSNQ